MTDYVDINRRDWDERAAIHARDATSDYMLGRFRAGEDVLHPIEAAEPGDIFGKCVLHLQCHIGPDTLCLIRRGTTVTGLGKGKKRRVKNRGLAWPRILGSLRAAPHYPHLRISMGYDLGAVRGAPNHVEAVRIRAWSGRCGLHAGGPGQRRICRLYEPALFRRIWRRTSDPPWVTAVAPVYYINLNASAVNGEVVQFERRDVNGPRLLWDRPANASVPAAHYVLDLGTGSLFVSFDKFEYDGRKFAGAARRLRCTDRLRKIAV